MAAGSSKAKETRINEPVQLYLAHRRLARAQLEIQIYTRLLQKELGPSLEKRTLFSLVYINYSKYSPDFEDITKESLPEGGLFAKPLEVSPV